MVTKREIEKTTVYPLLFLIYSIFSNRNQMSLFSHKAYDKLITMTGKKGGVPVLVGELEPFFNWQSSISRQIRHFFNVRMHERALNDNINYAQKGCAMQLWGITLSFAIIQRYLTLIESFHMQFFLNFHSLLSLPSLCTSPVMLHSTVLIWAQDILHRVSFK